ncbi:peptidase inhibitor family I36 protein [Kribbella sp. NBC_01505]|uniref:peptidase inhibitor family I36 protein n=1 Tax=Kribbella sp. NBC_01505 TaxID=2903580 RepID=UPI003863AEC0
MRSSRVVGIISFLIAVLSVSTAGSAVAAPAPPPSAPFTAQAIAAGLSDGQARWLQAEVDRTIARTGGTQTAPNQIQFDGATMTIALPGEQHPRNFSDNEFAPNAYCAYGHLCLYRGPSYTGTKVDLYACNSRYSLPGWTGRGSFINNQTAGTIADFYTKTGYYAGSMAYDISVDYDWTPIWYVRACST